MGIQRKPPAIYDPDFLRPAVFPYLDASSPGEPRAGALIGADTRNQIAALIEALIAFLDASDPDTEEAPVFPGHPGYQLPKREWVNHRNGMTSGLDIDREEELRENDDTDHEADLCDDEPNGDDEPDLEGEGTCIDFGNTFDCAPITTIVGGAQS